jgi:hypothetical protein
MVSARGAHLLPLIFAFESRTGFTAMAPSSMATADIPDRQARANSAAPGPLFFAQLPEGRLDFLVDH